MHFLADETDHLFKSADIYRPSSVKPRPAVSRAQTCALLSSMMRKTRGPVPSPGATVGR
jgi:hypothetical protein